MDREQRPLAYGTDPFSPTPTYPVVYLGRDPLSTEYPGRTHHVELSIQLRLLLPSWCERPPLSWSNPVLMFRCASWTDSAAAGCLLILAGIKRTWLMGTDVL